MNFRRVVSETNERLDKGEVVLTERHSHKCSKCLPCCPIFVLRKGKIVIFFRNPRYLELLPRGLTRLNDQNTDSADSRHALSFQSGSTVCLKQGGTEMVNRTHQNTARDIDKIKDRNPNNFAPDQRASAPQNYNKLVDDVIAHLANAHENRRARQVTKWEQISGVNIY